MQLSYEGAMDAPGVEQFDLNYPTTQEIMASQRMLDTFDQLYISVDLGLIEVI